MLLDKIFTELVVMNTNPVENNHETVSISVEPLKNVNKFISSRLYFNSSEKTIHHKFAKNPYSNDRVGNASYKYRNRLQFRV